MSSHHHRHINHNTNPTSVPLQQQRIYNRNITSRPLHILWWSLRTQTFQTRTVILYRYTLYFVGLDSADMDTSRLGQSINLSAYFDGLDNWHGHFQTWNKAILYWYNLVILTLNIRHWHFRTLNILDTDNLLLVNTVLKVILKLTWTFADFIRHDAPTLTKLP